VHPLLVAPVFLVLGPVVEPLGRHGRRLAAVQVQELLVCFCLRLRRVSILSREREDGWAGMILLVVEDRLPSLYRRRNGKV
jgi:hypothetical protein